MSRKISNKNFEVLENSVATEKKLSFLEKLLPPSILTILTALFYYPSLKYPFQFDDIANISKRFSIRFDDPLSRWWNNSRWISDLLNRLNYQFGGFNPFYYRFLNLIIHISTGLIIYYLIIDLFENFSKDSFLYKNSRLIAFTTSALFLLHPVQTQTVSYVIQARLEGLATLFVMATIFLFTKAFCTKNSVAKTTLLISSFIVAFLSCGTKEIVVVTPFLLLLVDWFFISQENWTNFKKHILIHSVFFVTFFIVIINYLNPDFFFRAISLKMSTANNRGNILTPDAYDIITPFQFLISEFKVILHYFFMFLWPFNISVEYDWKLSSSFFAADSFFPFIALLTIFSTSIYLLIKKNYTYISFGILWFFICVAPRASIIPSPELICDYKTYLASIGWLLILSIALVGIFKLVQEKINNLPEWTNQNNSQVAILSILMLAVGTGTVIRNTVWSSSSAFWRDIVIKAPLKARGHNNLGVALSEEGKYDEAIEHYQTAIQLDKHYADPLSNIAVAYSAKGDIDQAITALKGAINLFPNYAEAYNNLGTLLLSKKNYEDAERMLNTAIEIRPYYGKAFYNLGRLHLEKNNEELAWQYFKKATQGDLDSAEGFFTLGQISLKAKKYDEAIKAFETVISKGVNDARVVFNLANSYFMAGNFDLSQKMYESMIEKDPLNGKYMYNLAETYFAKKEFNKALIIFKKVTALPEPLAQSHFRIVACLEQLKQIDQAKNYLNELSKANAPDEFKKLAINELARIELEEKVKAGNGSVKMSEIQKILKKSADQQKDISKEAPQTA